jgi:TatD DNase family protein
VAELIDTHAHLDEVEDIDSVIAKSREQGVKAVIAMGQDLVSNAKTLDLASRQPRFIYPAIGLHPWSLGNMSPPQVAENVAFIRETLPAACALGEVGLDYDKGVLQRATKELQVEVLEQLLLLAVEIGKPVSLHSRYAWKDGLAAAKRAGATRLVFHWYTGLSSTLAELIEAGYYVSVTPAAEYHLEHRRAVRETPLERLLLETDSPVSYGRETRYRAQPSDVRRSLRAAAEIKRIDESELAEITTRNAMRLFEIA